MKYDNELKSNHGINLNIKMTLSFLSSLVMIMLMLVESPTITSSSRCSNNITSTCPNYEITNWNKKNIGQNIKEWIKSLRIEWNPQVPSFGDRQCNTFLIKKHTFFHNYGPDKIPDASMFLGKVMHANELTVWADLNNREEWIITQNLRKASARLHKKAVLKNGLYYGILNNNQIKLGK